MEGNSPPEARSRRILVPVSLAPPGETKLPVAVIQARAFGAELLLLHVIDQPKGDRTQVGATEARARAYLEMIATGLGTEGVDVHILIRYGPVARTILEEIDAQGADLVVIGTDVRVGMAKVLLGSIAGDVVAGASCPVMLVKPERGPVGGGLPVREFAEDLRRTGPVSPHPLGIRMVDPARIVGSVGRAHELDKNFRVRKPSKFERERYARVLAGMRGGDPLPPVILYKLGYGYYVAEGHRRVAAARQLGQREIAAEVTDFVATGDPLRRKVFAERRDFEVSTGLTRLGVALPGHYPRLGELIRQYAAALGLESLTEAGSLWESRVYRPVARTIRASGLSQYFPDRRTGDLFLLLFDYRNRHYQREGRELSWEEALSRLITEEAAREAPSRRTGRRLLFP